MNITRSFIALSLVGASALLAPPQASAFNPQPDPPARLGVVSLNPSQTLRLNARVARPPVRSALEIPSGTCAVSLMFLDGEGRSVGPSVIRMLRAGQATRIDLPGTGMSNEGNPLMIHPVVRVLPAAQHAIPAALACAVAVTLEVLDANGRTTALIEDPNLVTPDSVEQ